VKWFRGRGDAPAAPREEAAPAAEVHASLALGELFGRIHADSRLHVVDLGPAVGANLSFLSERFACSVEVVDLVHSLPPVVAGDPAAAVRETLPAAGEPADLVLAWDILNYLDRPQFRAAGEVLAARCRPGATLFAMIVTGKEMPREPGRYLLQEGRERGVDLVYRHAPGRRPAPRYRPAEVDQMLPGFSVDRSMLLRHGIQEFLMVRDRD
jgi:hypothetical protein